MARMIPRIISPDIKSEAEKHIFKLFRDARGTEDWIVLHSLGIAHHRTLIFGEVDFLVLVPFKGLFALEIKGGRVRVKDGIWSFTDRNGHTDSKARGPFEQVNDAVFSVIDYIKTNIDEAHQHLSGLFFGTGVMFPDISYSSVGCDHEKWQVYDENDKNDVISFINRLFTGTVNQWERVYGKPVPSGKLPNIEDIRYLSSILRGEFDISVSLNVQIQYSEERLKRLTDEQQLCIEQLEDNPRALILGKAGTGKTILAMETAMRAVADGKKVAFLCYNRNLGLWLKKQINRHQPELRPFFIGTLHSFMECIVQNEKHVSLVEKTSEYYELELPQKAFRILSGECAYDYRVDMVVIDEAQDIIKRQYLNVIDAMIHKGISHGNWYFFGDFSNQSIYQTAESEASLIAKIEKMGTLFIRYRLKRNCRNTEQICHETAVICEEKDIPETNENEISAPVSYITFSGPEQQRLKLQSILAKLAEENVPENSITILSPFQREKSVVSRLEGYSIKDYIPGDNNGLTFCTIHGFKGLENSVIILTDIMTFEHRQLIYVGYTRARSVLYVLESDEAYQQYNQILMRRLLNG